MSHHMTIFCYNHGLSKINLTQDSAILRRKNTSGFFLLTNDLENGLTLLDLNVDVDHLDAEQNRSLNKLGIKYGISSGAFSSLLRMDRKEQDETHQLKEIEKAKLALAVCLLTALNLVRQPGLLDF